MSAKPQAGPPGAGPDHSAESLFHEMMRSIGFRTDFLTRFFGATGLLAVNTVMAAVRRPFGFREILRQMHFVGVKGLTIVWITSIFVGMVLALQFAYGLARFGAQRSVDAADRFAQPAMFAQIAGDGGEDQRIAGHQRQCPVEQCARTLKVARLFTRPGGEVEQHGIALARCQRCRSQMCGPCDIALGERRIDGSQGGGADHARLPMHETAAGLKRHGGLRLLPPFRATGIARLPDRRSVAQLVEHRSPKPRAGGSNPSTPANRFDG